MKAPGLVALGIAAFIVGNRSFSGLWADLFPKSLRELPARTQSALIPFIGETPAGLVTSTPVVLAVAGYIAWRSR